MPKFDIFIKGIDPERMNEADAIRVNVAKALQISESRLDELLTQPSACIRRDANEEEAKNYQRTLSKLGLISLYSPVKRKSNLELIPMAEEIVETSVICPNCQHEMELDEEGVAAEKCTECGISIAQFLEQKKRNEEREAIKAKFLASQATIQMQATKKQQIEAEKQRKLDLEKKVLEELQGEGAIKKPLNFKLLAIGGGLCIVIGGANYFLTDSTVAPPISTTSTSVNSVALTPGSETKSTGSTAQNATPMDAQEAMKKTHDQAAQVLKGFGLNPDAFADAGSVASPSTSEAAPLTSVTGDAPTLTKDVPEKKPAVPVSVSLPPLNSQELFSVLNNDIAWDNFLAKNTKILLDRQLPDNAAKLSKLIVAHDVYVSALGGLLKTAQHAKQTKLVDDYLAALETRLTPLLPEQQAVYFAQTGEYLALENGNNRLLARAESLLASVSKPELQLDVILKLAVIHSKTGNIAMANNYFNKINGLLTPITDADIQVASRASVARAYQDINNSLVAAQWLTSTAPQLKQIKLETISGLLTSYAYCNQGSAVLKVLTQIDAKEHYDLWLYQAIGASLKAGFVPNALELYAALHAPVYKALANVAMAEYSPAPANELVENATQILNEKLATPAEKAIVASRLVSYYGKLKNTAKIEVFIKTTQEALEDLPISVEKDDIISIVVAQYTHGLQPKAASNLLTAIQSSLLKTRLNVEINNLADVGGLLK